MNYILKNNKKQCWRHGETLGVLIKKLPDGLKPSKSKVFMVGSHGHNHEIDNGTFYPKQDGIIFGYLEAKNTSLLHPEHSPKVGDAKIDDGYYELRKGQEYVNGELKVIVD